jgi:predicted aldo/keto reductase-like oxidoreductase
MGMSNHKTVVVIQARIIHKYNYTFVGTTVMYNFVKNINFYIT